MMDKPETPYPRHWLYYLVLKLVLLALGVALAVSIFGFFM